MKTTTIIKTLGVVVLTALLSNHASAQRITGGADFPKSVNANPGVQDGSVRVIDNKGTIKYLQTKNGLTTITNTTADVTTTTWQLGGALTDNTYIDAAGKVFAIDGVKLITAADLPSTDATNASIHGTGTGYTLLVRDELTGETKKMLATDLLQSGQEVFTAAAAQTAFPLTGGPVLPAYQKVYVYRNGAKLIANVDYTIAGSTVTLVPIAFTTTSTNDWSVNAGDIIEVHYVK